MGRKKAPRRPDLVKEMILQLMDHSLAVQKNADRMTYSPRFKETIVKAKDSGMSYEELNELTDIPIKTLENFRASVLLSNPKKKLLMKGPFS
jgi:DNA-directed RNA polymerase specialized sigma24 family protein